MTRFVFNPKPPASTPTPAAPAGSQRLPAVRDDPSVVAGFAAKTAFAAKIAAIRSNPNHSEQYKAAQIATAWDEATAELARLRTDFDARYQARWDTLQASIPRGPDIAEGTSPADRAALQAAFQAAVDRARTADLAELGRMYTDARRFGDDIAARAAFVVSRTEGRGQLVDRYAADHPEVGAALSELSELQLPAGRGFISQALGLGPLGQFPEPPEVAQAAKLAPVDPVSAAS